MAKGKLRRDWTAKEVAEQARESDESLPEAISTPRRPEEYTAGGSEHMTGEEQYEEPAGDEEQVVADPPLRVDSADRDQV